MQTNWRTFLPLTMLALAAVTLSAQTPELDTDALEGVKVLKANGVGTTTSAASLYAHVSVGVVKGTVFGVAKFRATLNDDPWGGNRNGSGGACVLGSGPIVLTTPDGSTLAMEQASLSCDTSANPYNLTDNGTYLIVGGTGRFAGATGTGNVVTGFKGSQVSLHLDGNIVLGTAQADSDSERERPRAGSAQLGGTSETPQAWNANLGSAIFVDDAKSDEESASGKRRARRATEHADDGQSVREPR